MNVHIQKSFPREVQMNSRNSMDHSAFLYQRAQQLLTIANCMRYGVWRNKLKGLTPRDTAIFSNQVSKLADDMFKQHLDFESERVASLKRIKHPSK